MLDVKSALYSITVALIVLFALPISQLRTVSIRVECCCPDPTNCHCPDHEKNPNQQASIKACHKSSQAFEASTSPEFVPAPIETLSVPPRVIAVVEHAPTLPHESPPLDPPRGPS
ncbi:hypothetical protein BH11MYX3_BH11MYX3_45720 [soil metagenome]